MAPERTLPRYDVVIATRNRVDALALSLPLILGQRPAPREVIVVDASDDSSRVQEVLQQLDVNVTTPIRVLRSASGLPLQRNIGLEAVGAPVVFFPDDDALWHPDFARRVLEVYARDTEERVGGVGGMEVEALPRLSAAPMYARSSAARRHLNGSREAFSLQMSG